MPFQPFTPPTNDLDDYEWPSRPLPPPQVVTQVSTMPVTPRRKRRWWLWLIIGMVSMLFEPVRILGITLVFFWILAIGMMPHVAILKVATGGHRR